MNHASRPTLRTVRHEGGSFVSEREDSFGLVLSLSSENQVSWTSSGRTSSAPSEIGTVSLLPPGVKTVVKVVGACHIVMVDLPWNDMTGWLSQDFDLDPFRVEIQSRFRTYDPDLAKLVYGALSSEDPDRDSALRALTAHLWLTYSATDRSPNVRAHINIGGIAASKLRKLYEFLEHNNYVNVNLNDISHEINLSPFHLSREFKKTTGMTIYQHMMAKRIQRAISLLSDKSNNIHDIATQTGFTHSSNLNRHFQRMTGLTATSFRRHVIL